MNVCWAICYLAVEPGVRVIKNYSDAERNDKRFINHPVDSVLVRSAFALLHDSLLI